MIAGIDPRHDALSFRQGHAEPVHAGVDVNGGAAVPAGAAAEHVPFGQFVEVADDRPGVDPGILVAAILEEPVEHIQRGLGNGGADIAGFIQRGDKEGLAAGAGQRARHRAGAAAIGIGLDHTGAFGRHRGLFQLAPVGDDGVEIDGQHAGRGRHRGGLVGVGRRARRSPGSISDRGRCSCRGFTRSERRGSTVQETPQMPRAGPVLLGETRSRLIRRSVRAIGRPAPDR